MTDQVKTLAEFSTDELLSELERREPPPEWFDKLKNRRIFTTGQVATICDVAPRTATRWIDKGLLKAYRIPGSQDRRVTRMSLVAFLIANDMPTYGLEKRPQRKVRHGASPAPQPGNGVPETAGRATA